jgi:hypothetical protein
VFVDDLPLGPLLVEKLKEVGIVSVVEVFIFRSHLDYGSLYFCAGNLYDFRVICCWLVTTEGNLVISIGLKFIMIILTMIIMKNFSFIYR